MEALSLTALAATIYNIVKPIITSKPAKDLIKAAKGSSEELWEKIKPWFIIEKEESKEIKELKNNPDNEKIEQLIIEKIKEKLETNTSMKNEINQYLKNVGFNGTVEERINILLALPNLMQEDKEDLTAQKTLLANADKQAKRSLITADAAKTTMAQITYAVTEIYFKYFKR